MAEHSSIEWTDATWNIITGCSVISPGCTNCYAMRLSGTRLKHHPSRAGLTADTKAGPVWNGEVRFNREWLRQPLEWKQPRKIFVCAHGDLFHESVPDEWLDEIFAVVALAQHHIIQILTKRAPRMRAYLSDPDLGLRIGAKLMEAARGNAAAEALVIGIVHQLTFGQGLPHVWLGISAEDQARADERVPELLLTPAAVRWVSAEPLLGPIDLEHIQAPRFTPEDAELDWRFSALSTGDVYEFRDSLGFWESGDGPWRNARLDWVVAGGESGPDARPMHPDWARSLRDQCVAAGVPFHFKQNGAWTVEYDRDRDDPDWRKPPRDDQHPNARYLNLAGGFGFHGERVLYVRRVGKKVAGRLLDGRTWDELPKVAA